MQTERERETVGLSCWYCGKKIGDPKYRVRENLYNRPGATITTPIHKSCWDKTKNEKCGDNYVRVYLTLEVYPA